MTGRLQCDLYSAMSYIKEYNRFASSAGMILPNETEPNRPAYNLESLHDEIHNAVGGWQSSVDNTERGTMYYLEISAFDPIFWLHHAMVDRMVTMFQVLNPDSWITPQGHRDPLWTIREGQIVDGNTRTSYRIIR